MAALPTYRESAPPALLDDLSSVRGSPEASATYRSVTTNLGGGTTQVTYVDVPLVPTVTSTSLTR